MKNVNDLKSKGEIHLQKGMGLFDLVLFNIVAVVGLRWAAVAAGIGPSSLLLWFFAMLLFFVPSALVVTELSARMPGQGGIYIWTKEAFGPFEGYICGFFYWVNNLVYYPNLLIFLGSTFLFSFGSRFLHLENNTAYSITFSLVVLWIAVITNMLGVRKGKWLQNMGSAGTWIPAGALIFMGLLAFIRYGSATVFTKDLIPRPDPSTLSAFSNLCFGFAGMELQACMSQEIENPRRNIPRAILISGIIAVLIYIAATSALLLALPKDQINIISGVAQVISKVSEKVNLPWIGMVMAFFMTLGGLGGIGAWMSGTARIPFAVGIDNYLPPWLAEIHPKWGTPANTILTMGLISTLFIFMAGAGSTVKEAYQLLVVGTLILYFIPYVYLFASFIRLKTSGRDFGEGPFNYPWWTGLLGLLSTILAIVLSLAPPGDVSDPVSYEIKLVGGVLFFVALGWIMFISAEKSAKAPETQEGDNSHRK